MLRYSVSGHFSIAYCRGQVQIGPDRCLRYLSICGEPPARAGTPRGAVRLVVSMQRLYPAPFAVAECFGELLCGYLVPCSDAGNKLYLQEEASGVACVLFRDEEHGSIPFRGC